METTTATTAVIGACLSELEDIHRAGDGRIERILSLLTTAAPGEQSAAAVMLAVAKEIGRSGQVLEGALTRALAQADRVKAARGGLAPWIATNIDIVDGRARGLAQSARENGHLPELAATLTSGRIGAGTIRALTRAARATKGTDRVLAEILTETQEIATKGISEANRRVRILEERLNPGHTQEVLKQQKARPKPTPWGSD